MIYRPSEHLYTAACHPSSQFTQTYCGTVRTSLTLGHCIEAEIVDDQIWCLSADILQFSSSYNAIQKSGFVTYCSVLRELYIVWNTAIRCCFFINFVDVEKFIGNYVSGYSRVGTVIFGHLCFRVTISVAVQIARQWTVSATVVCYTRISSSAQLPALVVCSLTPFV